MPNWCNNKLTVRGPKAEVERFVEEARGPEYLKWHAEKDPDPIPETALSLPKLVPPGQALDLLGFQKANPIEGGIEQFVQEIVGIAPPSDGYAWQLQSWGTKWGVSVDAPTIKEEDGNSVALYDFGSAWSPIVPAVMTIGANWPLLNFHLEFMEESMCFYGEAEVIQGSVVNDYTRDLENEDIQKFYGMTDEEFKEYQSPD